MRLTGEKGPNQIDRLDRERQVGIIANLDPRLPIGDAVKQMAPKVTAGKLPPGYTTKYLGRAQILAEARVNFLIALGRGDGSASRAAMATVAVGGQSLCLLLTLLVTPVLYTYFDDLRSLRVGTLLRLSDWFWDRLRWIPGRVARPPAQAPASPPAGRPVASD